MAKYPPELDTVIWALACEGVGVEETLRRLREGIAGGIPPVDMPRRTLTYRLRKLRDIHGDPLPPVDPADELDTAVAIRRRTLRMMERQLRRLERAERNGKVGASELRELRELVKTTDEIERRQRLYRKQADGTIKNPSAEQAELAQHAKAGTDESLLDKLIAAEEELGEDAPALEPAKPPREAAPPVQ